MKMDPIPFNKPTLTGDELKNIAAAIEASHISGDGQFTKKCHALLEQELGVPKVLLTTSCTHALEMSALLLEIAPGDEVIVPSFTFVSTINAFVLRGAKPVFIDSRPDTLNLDEQLLEPRINSRTKAIVPVHYAGVGCEMDTILKIADRHNVAVVEDNAHGLFGKYKGKNLGTFGRLATQSFHETKNITCGEGGALLINDPRYIERAEILREKGTNRSRFFRGEIDKYTWVDLGSSYLPTDILGAFLYAQLTKWRDIQAKRREVWLRYYRMLEPLATRYGFRLPIVPGHCEQPYHMFYILLPSLETRVALTEHMKANAIYPVFHYLPLHLSEMARRWGYAQGDYPVAESTSDRLLRLPFYTALTEREQERVVELMSVFFSQGGHTVRSVNAQIESSRASQTPVANAASERKP